MSIIGKLNRPNFRPTKSDKILIKYILENLNEIPYTQISNLANNVGIGEATITRCVKKLGCSGFQDFKLGLAKEITIRNENSILNVEIKHREPTVETAAKIAENSKKIIEETLSLISNYEVSRICEKILNSKRVFFAGIGFSGITAKEAHYKFLRIGINSYYYDNNYEILMMASLASEGDIIFTITNSGATEDLIKAMKIAKDNKAEIVCISGSVSSEATKLADENLMYYTDETLLETGSMSTSIAQSFIIEVLYTEVVKESLIEATNTKVKTTEVVKRKDELKEFIDK